MEKDFSMWEYNTKTGAFYLKGVERWCGNYLKMQNFIVLNE